jgi:Protein of unknown function (DUF2924)
MQPLVAERIPATPAMMTRISDFPVAVIDVKHTRGFCALPAENAEHRGPVGRSAVVSSSQATSRLRKGAPKRDENVAVRGLAVRRESSNVCGPGEEPDHMKNSIAKGDLKGLAAALDAISSLSPEELDAQWKALYGSDSPDRLRRPLMIQALAYRIQEQAFGGLKPATRRLLRSIAGDIESRSPIVAHAARRIKAGAVLIREWHGTKHHVTALKDGFMFRGKTLPIAFQNRWRDHRYAMVRATLFRSEKFSSGEETCNPLNRRRCAAQSTPENHLRKDSSKTLIRSTLNVRRANRSSRARRAKAGG